MIELSSIKKEDIPKYIKEEKKCPVWSAFGRKRGLVGAEGCRRKTIVGSDGSFAPEPHPNLITFWVYDHKEKRLHMPETLKCEWSLAEGRLPISEVKWKTADIEVETTIFAAAVASGEAMINFARTSIRNAGPKTKDISLYVVIRHCGLFRRRDEIGVKEIEYNGNDDFVRINGRIGLCLKEKPDAFGFSALKDGDIWEFAGNGLLPSAGKVTDEVGYASGALVYRMKLERGKKKIYDFTVPSQLREKGEFTDCAQNFDFNSSLKDVKKYWKRRIPLELYLPDEEYSNCFFASLYYILILMTGRELWAGPYAPGYDSLTLHDAVEMADALDKAGLFNIAKGALARFNYKQTDAYLDGLGGSTYAFYEHYRITKDKRWLRKIYPKMLTNSKRIKWLRSKESDRKSKGNPVYGLLPESASQDNFSRKAHLYVDNWWGLIGIKAALEAAKVLKRNNDLKWLKREYEDFLGCLLENFKKVMRREKVSYIPAFADYWPPAERIVDNEHRILGDTQMAWAHRPALFPGISLGIPVPLDLLKQSYEHYWKRSGAFSNYDGGWYVEYEKYFWGYNVMLAHPLLFLGMEDVALKNIEWSLKHQSCPGGWMEAMNTRVNKKGFREIAEGVVCDVPHGWSAAHYVLTLRDMLLREEQGKLILLSGIPRNWLSDGKRIELKNVPTYFGRADFRLESHLKKGYLKLRLTAKETPPNGYVFISRLNKNIREVKIDGRRWGKFEKKKVIIPAEANEILIYYKDKI